MIDETLSATLKRKLGRVSAPTLFMIELDNRLTGYGKFVRLL